MAIHKPSLVLGLFFGFLPIIFVAIGLATPFWVTIDMTTTNLTNVYGLFQRCTKIPLVDGTTVTNCIDLLTFRAPEILVIAGFVLIIVGVITATILQILLPQKNLYMITPFLPMIGSILILIGFITYTKYVIEDYTKSALEVTIGYSMILMIIACIYGFLATVHYSFVAGYIYRQNRPIINRT